MPCSSLWQSSPSFRAKGEQLGPGHDRFCTFFPPPPARASHRSSSFLPDTLTASRGLCTPRVAYVVRYAEPLPGELSLLVGEPLCHCRLPRCTVGATCISSHPNSCSVHGASPQLLVLPFNRSMPLFSAEVPDTARRAAQPFGEVLRWTTHFPLRDCPSSAEARGSQRCLHL